MKKQIKMKTVRVDKRTLVQVPVTMPDDVAINRYKKRIIPAPKPTPWNAKKNNLTEVEDDLPVMLSDDEPPPEITEDDISILPDD